ncbi:apoptosis regulator BAX-like [Haliotis cracherodii]|uniref:apoptosis regulator BAX-like n=1 Tax=Haliotis cracherodii TaxID=6455 RepID=UPI0039E83B03
MTYLPVMMTSHGVPLQQRRGSATLTPLVMPPRGCGNGVNALPNEDLVEEGKELFHNFVLEDIHREEMSVEDLTAQISTPAGYKNPMWAKTGRELRHMADEFAKTKERKRLANKAASVDINLVTFEQFRDLLSELFHQDDFTKERVMILFCFCSDLAVRGLRIGVELCCQVVSWSLRFITDTVCSIIQTLGGWSQVVCRNGEGPLGYVMVAVVAVVGTVLVMRYLKQ